MIYEITVQVERSIETFHRAQRDTRRPRPRRNLSVPVTSSPSKLYRAIGVHKLPALGDWGPANNFGGSSAALNRVLTGGKELKDARITGKGRKRRIKLGCGRGTAFETRRRCLWLVQGDQWEIFHKASHSFFSIVPRVTSFPLLSVNRPATVQIRRPPSRKLAAGKAARISPDTIL